MIRLQKVLADRGVASRRRAEDLILRGRVRVDGEVVTTLGTRVRQDARIDVDGVATGEAPRRYLVLNKPAGVVSTAHDERGRRTVVDVVGARERLYPVGRLDTDSEGMLLLTNDGDWAERVLHPRYGHEREYDVSVTGELSPEVMTRLRLGVRLEEGLARAVRIDVLSRSRGTSRLRMVLHTGWRRQIRRMLAAVGLRTVRLVRVRIGSVPLGHLKIGEWRELTPAEIADLARPQRRDRGAAPARKGRDAKGRDFEDEVERARDAAPRSGTEGPRTRGVPVATKGRGAARREGFGAATRRMRVRSARAERSGSRATGARRTRSR